MPTYNLNDIVSNESHAVSVVNSDTYHTLIPLYGPFFKESVNLVHVSSSGVVTPQVPGVDFNFALMWISASRVLNDILYGAVTIQTPKDNGYYRFNSYKTAGSQWNIPVNQVYAFLVNNAYNPRIASWEQVIGEPALYPPTPHTQPLTDFKGFDEFILAIDRMANHIMSSPALSGHAMDPDAHGMMKANNVEIGVAVDDVINNRPITTTIADKVITLKHLKQFIEESGMLAPDSTGAVSVQDLVNHSNSTTTHNDIRLLIAALTNSTNNSVSALTSNLNNHTTAVDPHPQYTTSTEVDSAVGVHNNDNTSHADIRTLINTGSTATNLAISTLTTNLVNHTSGVDPHPQYLNESEVDSKISTHTSATDPHPQYTTNTEVDDKVTAHNNSATSHSDIRTSLVNLQTSITNHASASDPHSQYTNESEVDSKISTHDVANVSHSDIRQALATLDSSASKVIAGDYTVHVKHTPNVNNSNEFSTLQEAWDYLKGKYVLGRTTIQIEAGAYLFKSMNLNNNRQIPKWTYQPTALLREIDAACIYITGGNGVLSSEVVMTHDCETFGSDFVHHEHTSIIYNGVTFVGISPIGTYAESTDVDMPYTNRVLQFNHASVRFGDKGQYFFNNDEEFSVSVQGGMDGVGYHMADCWGGRLEIKDHVNSANVQGASRVFYDYLNIKGKQLTKDFYTQIIGHVPWMRGDSSNYRDYDVNDKPLEGKIMTSNTAVIAYGGVFSTNAIKTKRVQFALLCYDNGHMYIDAAPLNGAMGNIYPTVVSDIEADRYVVHCSSGGSIVMSGPQWAYDQNRMTNLPTNNPITLPRNKIKCGVGGIMFYPYLMGKLIVDSRWELDIHRDNEIPGYISTTEGKTTIAHANRGGQLYMGMKSQTWDDFHNSQPANINNQVSSLNSGIIVNNPLNFTRTYRNWLKDHGKILGRKGAFREDKSNTYINMYWVLDESRDDTNVFHGDPSETERVNPTSGYVKLSNGFIFQWGKFVSIPINTYLTVTFPITFPNACLGVTVTPVEGVANILTASVITPISCVLDNYSDVGVELEQANWMAFGF